MAKEKNNNKKKADGKNRKPEGIGRVLTGVIQGNSKGYGFLICKERGNDVFIPAGDMNGAIHGDEVEAVLVSRNKGGGEGEVKKVLKREKNRIVGMFISAGASGYLKPDDARLPKDIYIPKNMSGGALEGEKVVAQISEWERGRNNAAKVIEVLGKPEDKGVDMLSIIRAYGLYDTFPAGVEKETRELPDKVSETEKNGRRDFTEDLVITIDGDDARDFDDAVYLTREGENFRLYVHIADTAHYVRQGSGIDKEAYKRGTSVYFPDMVLPMLPQILSNGICSLVENEDRLTLSVIMDVDGSGNVFKHKIKEGVIKSKHRMTYSKVAAILDGDNTLCKEYSDTVPMLKEMKTLADILTQKRKNRGTIEFDVAESEIILDENGKTADIRKRPRLVSHRIIEEFMILANETIAQFLCSVEAPGVFRVHDKPPAEKTEKLTEFLAALGMNLNASGQNPSPSDFARLLKETDPRFAAAINRMTLRSMAKANYEPQNKGHFGLASEFYCHFTSPIRRYPDLVMHRIIKDFLKNGKKVFDKYKDFTTAASNMSGERERLAEQAEREVDDLKKAEFMKDKIGEYFNGVISGVTEWGIFVELDNSVEGLIKIEKLPGDGYEYNPAHMTISNNAATFRLGQPLEVKVESVNYDQVNFELS